MGTSPPQRSGTSPPQRSASCSAPSSPQPGTPPSQRTRVRRVASRATYDRHVIDSILDEGRVAHLAIAIDGQPYAIPTLHARVGDAVYIHGSAASRAIRNAGAPVCLTVTLLDGLVLARSAFHHSVNYRSAMVIGHAQAVADVSERLLALRAFAERLLPGRWAEVRPPSPKELKGTGVLRIALSECSAKARSGPPIDDEEDHELDVWAGVVPLRTVPGAPQPDPRLRDGIEPSLAVRALLLD